MNDEFKALDINLDVPLREDEKLFVPTPYKSSEAEKFRLPLNKIQSNNKKLKKTKKKVEKKPELGKKRFFY